MNDFTLIKSSDDVTADGSRCIIIEFKGSKSNAIKAGWLGDERIARVFVSNNSTEIRIFKQNDESYVLSETSLDKMVLRKCRLIRKAAGL